MLGEGVFMKSLYGVILFGLLMGFPAHSQEQDPEKVWFEAAKREMAIIVTDEGFYPKNISVFQGEKITLYLTSTAQEDRCFMIQQKGIFVPVAKNQLKILEVEFDREETLDFHCPVGNMRGKISILEHPDHRRDRLQKRELASESTTRQPKIWMPREE
jgi:hypothetical protein